MIEFKSVFLSFDGRPILENISFTLKAGETMVILGGSGSGKTTILRLILGLIHPNSGDILIEGRSIVGLSEQEMTDIRAMMALVFQHAALFASLTVRENVGYRFWEKDVLDEEEIEQRVSAAVEPLADGAELRDRADVAGRIEQDFLGPIPNLLVLHGEIADADAGHRVRLAEREHRNGALVHARK